MIKKNITLLLFSLSLTACVADGSVDPTENKNLELIDANQTAGTYVNPNNKIVSANLTFRASSAFLANGVYTKVNGYKITAAYGKTEVGEPVTSYVKNAGNFDGILTSTANAPTNFVTLVETFTTAQLGSLNSLRGDINTLEAELNSPPAGTSNAQIGAWKVELKDKYASLSTLVSYGGLQTSVRALPNGNGFYGLFVNKSGSDYRQISGVYAKADGVSNVDYSSLSSSDSGTYTGNFKGGAVVNGQLIDLVGLGSINANFSTNVLSGAFNLSNSSNTETGNLTVGGTMAANSSGSILNNNGATYTAVTGQLSSMTGGYTEAAVFDGGSSILGSVNFTNGSQALVGGFGVEK